MNACVCGALLTDHGNEGSPITHDAGTGKYRLEASPDIVVEDMRCLMCGGQGIGVRDRMCACGTVERWAAMEDSPVYRNEHNGLLMLKGRERSDGLTPHYAIWYCPVCGGRMDEAAYVDEV